MYYLYYLYYLYTSKKTLSSQKYKTHQNKSAFRQIGIKIAHRNSFTLPEMSGNSVSPIRAPQDTPEILAWLNLPYDDDTPMPTSFVTRRRLIVESTPEANPGQVDITQDEPLGPYRARIENLASRRRPCR